MLTASHSLYPVEVTTSSTCCSSPRLTTSVEPGLCGCAMSVTPEKWLFVRPRSRRIVPDARHRAHTVPMMPCKASRALSSPCVRITRGREAARRARAHSAHMLRSGNISFHPSTSAHCSSVSGERLRPSGVPRRRSAIRVSASLPSIASCSTSQQPITVPVRPIPPQQCTYDGVPADTFALSWERSA